MAWPIYRNLSDVGDFVARVWEDLELDFLAAEVFRVFLGRTKTVAKCASNPGGSKDKVLKGSTLPRSGPNKWSRG